MHLKGIFLKVIDLYCNVIELRAEEQELFVIYIVQWTTSRTPGDRDTIEAAVCIFAAEFMR